MLPQNNEYRAVIAYFQSLNFHFLESWLFECVNYYKSTKPNISLEDLKREVKQQWLLTNLREVKVPSLPSSLASRHKIILEGKYAVQVEAMIDCSVSCFSQFQKFRNVCNENIEVTTEKKDWEIKSKRCLTFKICDGVQELQAMEYQPIKKIRNNDPELLPGFKMIIIGPVECRKGMILLKDENVRICGGEVDTLTTTNNLKSLILRKLELDENDYPEDFNHIDTQNTQPVISPGTQICEESVATLLSQNDDIFLNLSLEPESFDQQDSGIATKSTLTAPTNSSSIFDSNILDEDQEIFMFSNKKLCAIEKKTTTQSMTGASLHNNMKTDSSTTSKSNINIDSMDVDEIFIDDIPLNSSISMSKNQKQTKLSSYFKNDVAPVPTQTFPKPLIKLNCEPFVYLNQVSLMKTSKPVVCTVKVIILTLTKKITINNDEYSLRANITDGSMALDVDFSSSVIEDLLDFSPSEMMSMMKVKHSNSAINSRIKDSFSKAQEKLISLNCLLKIKFFHNDKIPLVLSLQEVNIFHLNALKERQNS